MWHLHKSTIIILFFSQLEKKLGIKGLKRNVNEENTMRSQERWDYGTSLIDDDIMYRFMSNSFLLKWWTKMIIQPLIYHSAYLCWFLWKRKKNVGKLRLFPEIKRKGYRTAETDKCILGYQSGVDLQLDKDRQFLCLFLLYSVIKNSNHWNYIFTIHLIVSEQI